MEIRRKVTWVGEDWSFSIIRDYTKRAEELMKYEGFAEEDVQNYYRPGTFTIEFVRQNKGEHFLYGEEESLMQSDSCPPQLHESKILQYIVEEVDFLTMVSERCRKSRILGLVRKE